MKKSDPANLKDTIDQTEKNRLLANEWTDCLWEVASWMENKNPTFDSTMRQKAFGIPEDLDDIPK